MQSKGQFLKLLVIAVCTCLITLNNSCTTDKPSEDFDIIIKDTLLIDGTGSPGRRTDIGIIGERIQYIGKIYGEADVIINGAIIIDDGRMTEALPGHVIRHNQ